MNNEQTKKPCPVPEPHVCEACEAQARKMRIAFTALQRAFNQYGTNLPLAVEVREAMDIAIEAAKFDPHAKGADA